LDTSVGDLHEHTCTKRAKLGTDGKKNIVWIDTDNRYKKDPLDRWSSEEKKNLKPMDRYNRSKIKFFSPMIDTIGLTSKIFNHWIDTFGVKHDG
jgi:hypothetical protein